MNSHPLYESISGVLNDDAGEIEDDTILDVLDIQVKHM
jgi:hypothetical protein